MLNKLKSLKEKMGTGVQQVISNLAWLFTDKIFQMGTGLIIGAFLNRLLGPEDIGLFNYAIAFVTLFSPIAQMGLDSLVVRDIARDPLTTGETLGTTFVIKITGGIITFILAILVIIGLKPDEVLTHNLVTIIAGSTIFLAFDTIDFWFQSKLLAKYTVIPRNIVYIIISLTRISLIIFKAPVIAFAWAKLLESGLGALALIIAYRVKGESINTWKFNFQRAKELINNSWPLILTSITVIIYSKIDQVMLGSLLPDPKPLGYYSVAVKISEIFDFIPWIIYTSLIAKLTEQKAKSNESYLHKFQIYFDLMFILWLAVAIPVSLLSPVAIAIYGGEKFTESAKILSIYVWAQFGSNFGLARNAYLIIEGKMKMSFYLSIFGAALNIVLNAFLIPMPGPLGGAIGATVATLITYFAVTVLINFFIKDLNIIASFIIRSVNIYKSIFRLRELIK